MKVSSNVGLDRDGTVLSHLSRLLLILALLVVLAACNKDDDHEAIPTIDKSLASAVAHRIDADTIVTADFARCPADLYRRRVDLTGIGRVPMATCAGDVDGCLAQCLSFSSGAHCFALARILQAAPELDQTYGEKLYQMACSSGQAAGCTNRGAGIRNGRYERDPFTTKPKAERESCTFRSFETACRIDDPWGCTMLGQAYQEGEGVTANGDKARQLYRKSCSIARKHAACSFARGQLDELKAP